MITINADKLSDGLYNIKNGQIFKYRAKGGTVRTYEMGEIVRCKGCRHRYMDGEVTHYYWCRLRDRPIDDADFCSWGEERSEE